MSLLLKGRSVLVVGAGAVAEQAIPRLIAAGADITLCHDGHISVDIYDWAEDGKLRIERVAFAPAMLWGKAMVVCCDAHALRDVVVHADKYGVLVEDLTEGDEQDLSPVQGRRASRAGDLAGTVALIGGGPGESDLITVKGRRLLRLADVVLTDHLGPLSLLEELDPDVEIIDAAKLPYGRAMAQERINELLIEKANQGLFVVRLKGGDPYVFGRGYEEVLALRDAGIKVKVVPGITSAISVPAAAGIPVTQRRVTHEFTVISGHVPPGHPTSLVNWEALAQMNGTLAIIMGVKNGPAIADALLEGGRSSATPAVVIQEGTTANQKVHHCTLGNLGETIRNEGVKPPAVILVGDVAELFF